MPIHVVVLDREKRRDRGCAPHEFDLTNPFDHKLDATGFKYQPWSLIDGELFKDSEFPLSSGKVARLGSARLNQSARAFFVTYTTSIEEEFVIVVGYMFDHDHDNYKLIGHPVVQGQMTIQINEKIAELEAQALHSQLTAEPKTVTLPSPNRTRRREIQLSRDQQAVHDQLLSGAGIALWAPAGSGKTEIAIQLLQAMAPEINALVLVPHRALRRKMVDEIGARHTIETWQMMDDRICAHFAKANIPAGFLKLEHRIPADFSFFQSWWKETIEDRSTHSELKERIGRAQLKPRLVYHEIIYNILQPNGDSLETLQPVITREAYFASTHDAQERSNRDLVYAVFQHYQTALQASTTHFDSHTRLFQIFTALQDVKAQSGITRLKALFVDKIIIDEFQRANPMLAYIAFFLLKGDAQEKQKNHLVCGDPFQDLYNKQLRISSSYRKMLQLFGVENPALPVQLEDCFRCSLPVSQLANRLLCLYTKHLGSYLREETFAFRANVNPDASPVDFDCRLYDPDFVKAPLNNGTDVIVLIPNDADIEKARQLWPEYSVFHVADVAGLEKRRVIMFGFGDRFGTELCAIAEAGIPALSDTPNFSRKYKKESAVIHTEWFDALVEIYSGATRAQKDVVFVDQIPCIGLWKLTDDIRVKNVSTQAALQPKDELVVALPLPSALQQSQHTLKTALEYLESENSALAEEGKRILCSEKVWGSTENVDLANQWIVQKNIAMNDTNTWAAIITQAHEIVASGSIKKSLLALMLREPPKPAEFPASAANGKKKKASSTQPTAEALETMRAEKLAEEEAKEIARLNHLCTKSDNFFDGTFLKKEFNYTELRTAENLLKTALKEIKLAGYYNLYMSFRYATTLMFISALKNKKAIDPVIRSASIQTFHEIVEWKETPPVGKKEFPFMNNVLTQEHLACQSILFICEAHIEAQKFQEVIALTTTYVDKFTGDSRKEYLYKLRADGYFGNEDFVKAESDYKRSLVHGVLAAGGDIKKMFKMDATIVTYVIEAVLSRVECLVKLEKHEQISRVFEQFFPSIAEHFLLDDDIQNKTHCFDVCNLIIESAKNYDKKIDICKRYLALISTFSVTIATFFSTLFEAKLADLYLDKATLTKSVEEHHALLDAAEDLNSTLLLHLNQKDRPSQYLFCLGKRIKCYIEHEKFSEAIADIKIVRKMKGTVSAFYIKLAHKLGSLNRFTEETKLYCTEALKDPNLSEEQQQTVMNIITKINERTELQNAISALAITEVGMFAPPVVAPQQPPKDDAAIATPAI